LDLHLAPIDHHDLYVIQGLFADSGELPFLEPLLSQFQEQAFHLRSVDVADFSFGTHSMLPSSVLHASPSGTWLSKTAATLASSRRIDHSHTDTLG
jgi:hypothetical protein